MLVCVMVSMCSSVPWNVCMGFVMGKLMSSRCSMCVQRNAWALEFRDVLG